MQSALKQVRPQSPPLQARRSTTGGGVQLPSGQVTFPRPGIDWLIMRDGHVIDICDDEHLASGYTEIQEGTFLPKAACVRIEETTGIGTTRSAAELEKAIARLAAIQIGTIQIKFTPGQLEEIAHRAAKRGYTVEQELNRIVERIKDEIFYGSPARE